MPRLPTLRTRVLQELARHLRFESAEAARRQLVRAEELAMQLLTESGPDAPAAYPEDWVVFRITGLRTDVEKDGERGSVVVRDALLGDLPALIDRLSAMAKWSPGELGNSAIGTGKGRSAGSGDAKGARERWLSVEELCARWDVSRKTLERYRRLGLVSRRATLGRGREKVVYGEGPVRAFEAAHRQRVNEAGAFVRRDEAERAAIVRRAARYRARLGWTLHRCAQRIAVRSGRSVEGVRKLLRSHDTRAERPIFDEPGPLDREQQAWLERNARRGGSMSGAAASVRKSRATVYRVVGGRRAARLRELDLRGPTGPLFERADAAEVLLGRSAARAGLGAPGARTLGDLLRLAQETQPETAAVEQARAAACWYLIWRARQTIAGWNSAGRQSRRGETSSEMDEVETWLLWASRLKAELVRSQVPLLVRAIENQAGRRVAAIPGAALRELCERGVEALVDAADRFDPFKGGRLAAPAGLALGRAVSQWMRHSAAELGPAGRAIARVDLDQVVIADWSRAVHPWQEWLEAPAGTREKLSRLAQREQRVLELRFGWSGWPRTLAEVAAELGTTRTRVALMQRRAVAMVAYGVAPNRAKPKRKGAA